jgi:predicted ATPase
MAPAARHPPLLCGRVVRVGGETPRIGCRPVYAAAVAQRPILTPDRRLRVFVSSTLRELAHERAAAREAISSLHLAPVLFEQAARPHAPRDLYAAYVEQCDVFVGVYWQSYGWVAPGSQISGLEDEFDLGQGKPMLLYIKEPADEREDRLVSLISRIEQEAGSAYRTFSTAPELGALLRDDLALLLTERFHADADVREERTGLPVRTTSFVGRDGELGELVHLLERSEVRLVTLAGPGGIGKTRLAIEAARRLAPRFPDGAVYVPLDRLTDPDLLPAAVAEAVGFPSLGPDQELGLARRLRDMQLLLVLDNFEHLLASAPLVTRLLETASGLEVLATSREPLRLQGEHEYAVPPLANAPMLFMERVGAVRPDVLWDEQNRRAAHEICRRVDGLPLAVELIAAATRMLPPHALVTHLDSSLDAPSSGRRDAPARQQTVRATVDWSYQLLGDSERDVFQRLGAFGDSFTIEAARAVVGGEALAVLSALSALVDKSLLAHAASESETRFRMLHVVSEYAAELLDRRPDAGAIRIAHAEYYADLARAAYAGLRGVEQRGWKEVLDLDRENVRRTLAELEGVGRLDDAAGLVWSMLPYWLTGQYLEGRKLVGRLFGGRGELSDESRVRLQTVDGVLAALLSDIATAQRQLSPSVEWFAAHGDDEGRATALVGLGLATAPIDAEHAGELMRESERLFAGLDDAWAEAIVLGALGWLDTGLGDFAEAARFERGYSLSRRVDDKVSTAHNGTNLAELYVAQGRPEDARAVLSVALDAYEAVRLHDGLSYGLEAAAGLASTGGRPEEAARLLGAADGLRDEVGVPIWGPRLTRFESFVRSVREGLGGDVFEGLWAEGRALGYEGALEAARRASAQPGQTTEL